MAWITVTHNYKPLRFQIERLPNQVERERWKVIGRNGQVILSNNRPVLLRHSLKYRLPDWKIEGDTLWNRGFQAELFKAIDDRVAAGAIK